MMELMYQGPHISLLTVVAHDGTVVAYMSTCSSFNLGILGMFKVIYNIIDLLLVNE